MRRDQFQGLMKTQFERLLQTNKTKGHDYAGDDDALANFKFQATHAGITPFQVWSVFFGKHLAAINTFIREGDVQSEPVEDRIHDAILYLLLLLGLVEEQRHNEMLAEIDSVE